VLVEPELLAGDSQGHHEDVGPRGADLLDDRGLGVGVEVSVSRADHRQTGEPAAHLLGRGRRDPRPGAQEIEREPLDGRPLAEPGEHVGAVDVLADVDALEPGGHLDADAVGQHPRGPPEHGPVGGVGHGLVEAVGIDEREQRRPLVPCAVDDPVDGLVHARVGHLDTEDGEAGWSRSAATAEELGDGVAHHQARALQRGEIRLWRLAPLVGDAGAGTQPMRGHETRREVGIT